MERERLLLLGVAVALSTCWFGSLASAQIIRPAELKALKAIRKNLGDPLNELRNWKKNDPCTSNWTGVICTQIQDDGYLHIQELRLLKRNLTGTLAPELGVLTYVTHLYAAGLIMSYFSFCVKCRAHALQTRTFFILKVEVAIDLSLSLSLSHLPNSETFLGRNFMWNNISGSIPKEIGSMTSLHFLLLSGNNISGPLPDELGSLPNIKVFQLDHNQISGPLPRSFANLSTVRHFHMNNNSFSGQIPPELYKLPKLIHFLLDNNNLSGYLPPDFSVMPQLKILILLHITETILDIIITCCLSQKQKRISGYDYFGLEKSRTASGNSCIEEL